MNSFITFFFSFQSNSFSFCRFHFIVWTMWLFTPRADTHPCISCCLYTPGVCVCMCVWGCVRVTVDGEEISTMLWPLTVHPSALIASALTEALLLPQQQHRGPSCIAAAFDSWNVATHTRTHIWLKIPRNRADLVKNVVQNLFWLWGSIVFQSLGLKWSGTQKEQDTQQYWEMKIIYKSWWKRFWGLTFFHL